ncbi:MAG: NADH-quinone oxidoreductase subunit NuoH [Gemmatimonadetes bacterium]|jgi:NADH-quinone oxidoreductase subunit H|nr:NADH-quinone oxidoreductase subunit NuoH [Gemmatimonadota bacterium]
MQAFADQLITILGIPGALKTPFYALVILAFTGMILLGFVALFAGVASFVERRIAGRMQSRIGPNRVGPNGILQFLADGLKSLTKEDLVPEEADRLLFRFAPYIVFAGMFAAWVVVPFGDSWIAANLNIGIFYFMSVTSLVAIGLVMAGWSSNNKWSLLGGMRAAAQVISYEIPAGLALMTVVMLAGSLSTQEIIRSQGAWPWEWNAFKTPFTFITFFIYFIAALAEGNRTPFDLPEAESELVSGYNTEYSGMRFVFFFFAEWANLYLIGAMATIAFFGGWQLPGFLIGVVGGSGFLYNLLCFFTFLSKSLFWVFVVMWLRWTLPRLRIDQLMNLCWKYLVPISFICILGVAVWMLLPPVLSTISGILLSLLGFGLAVRMLLRARYNLRQAGEKPDWNILTV